MGANSRIFDATGLKHQVFASADPIPSYRSLEITAETDESAAQPRGRPLLETALSSQ